MSFISLNSYTSPINIEGLIGGGSGGTVELNGNNTFTGDNEFTQPLTTEKINIQANGLVVESGDIDLTLGGINLNVGNINLDAGDINIGGIISSTNSIGTTTNMTTNSLITTSIEFVGNPTLQTVPFIGTDQLFTGTYTSTIPSSTGGITQYTVLTMNIPDAGIYIMTGTMSMSSTSFIVNLNSGISYNAGLNVVWGYNFAINQTTVMSNISELPMNISCIINAPAIETLTLKVGIFTENSSAGTLTVSNLHLTQLSAS